jgi:hypothetical protein
VDVYTRRLSDADIAEIAAWVRDQIDNEVTQTSQNDQRDDPLAYVADVVTRLQRILSGEAECGGLNCPVHRRRS